tara:strand:+ start:1165 stop:1449 length:285 start_codon:yes stop_codon:yes gene_type:complete
MKTTSCTGKERYAFNNAPRCGAKTKRNAGAPCLSPAVRGKARCRIHGGAKGSGAQPHNKNALKHGFSTAEFRQLRTNIRTEIKRSEEFWENLID